MTQDRVIEVLGNALFTVIAASAPPLLIGLSVGLIIAIFQTVTSIQEQTLAFVPKIIAVFLSLLLFGPFILNTITGFFQETVRNLPNLVVPM